MTALTKINYRLLSHFRNEYSSNPAYMIVGEIPRGDCYALAPVVDYDSILLGLQGEIAAYHQDRRVGLLRKGEAYHLSVMTDDFVGLHNRSSKPARFLELIIKPSRDIHSAGHEAAHIDELKQEAHLRLIASGAGRDGSMRLHSDVDVYFGSLSKKETLVHEPQSMKRTVVHVVSGCVDAGGMRFRQFETAISPTDGAEVKVVGRSHHAEVLLIDAA